jgi:hypothetical protein
MRSVLLTLAAATAALLLCGCPDLPGSVPGAQSDAPRNASVTTHADTPAQHVGEIAWFQGTIDEAFSHRGCSESRPRRTLFRF